MRASKAPKWEPIHWRARVGGWRLYVQRSGSRFVWIAWPKGKLPQVQMHTVPTLAAAKRAAIRAARGERR